jgi:hypothetical protein
MAVKEAMKPLLRVDISWCMKTVVRSNRKIAYAARKRPFTALPASSRNKDALLFEIFDQIADKFQLFVDIQIADNGLKDSSNSHIVGANQTAIIDVGEDAHEESDNDNQSMMTGIRIVCLLAIHPICHPSVAWDAVAKVFDVKGAFEARRKEAPEGRDEGRKACKHKEMKLVWRVRDGCD